jgi:cytochrome bd-type quinol oxidase subunit 1
VYARTIGRATKPLKLNFLSLYLLKNRQTDFARWSLRLGSGVAMVATVLSLVTGHGFGVTDAGIRLFGWVDEAKGETYGPEIPGLLSWMVGGDRETVVTGLNDFDELDSRQKPSFEAISPRGLLSERPH